VGNAPRWVFGNEPLPEVVDLASELRELLDVVLALEDAPAELADLTAQVRDAREMLAGAVPASLAPRIGDGASDDMRVYVDHSRDVGDYNPAFPRYTLRCADDRAEGEVTFPICYEGPPGVVHGGFLALFFDCVLQQLNCDMGLAGKTTRLAVKYRRPTPLNRELRVVATRTVEDERIRSEAQLFDGDELVCAAEMSAFAGNRADLPAVSPRRAS
jgi:acyl-coenzyme A thioesterase PaaI-like protein